MFNINPFAFPKQPRIWAVGNSPISLVDLGSDLHQPEHENSLVEVRMKNVLFMDIIFLYMFIINLFTFENSEGFRQ